MSTERQRCFVIMPFSETIKEHTEDYWTKHFDSFLKPLIEESQELEAQRSEPLRGDILRQIITDLVICPVVVADLTDQNPNVYWELGVRQSFKHGTITIAQEETELPFDIGAKGTLFYSDNHLKNADFCRRFKEAIKDCLSYPDRPDSHVLETISGRGTLFEVFRRDEAMRRLDAVLSECDSNIALFSSYVEDAKNNQKYRSEKGRGEDVKDLEFLDSLLRSQALELLITDRYLDEDLEFYKKAERAQEMIVAVNAKVTFWGAYPSDIEKWVLEEHKNRGVLNDIKKQVLGAREKLQRRL